MLVIGLNAIITHIASTTSTSKTSSFQSVGNMLDIFRGLKSLVKVNQIKTDSPIFRLHYSITVMILMSFSLIITTRQYVGNPIDCIHTKDVPEDVLNTFCWIHSTYTMKHLFTKKVGEEVAYPGVGSSQSEKVEGVRQEPKVYRYYQWVCFFLFFQVKYFTLLNKLIFIVTHFCICIWHFHSDCVLACVCMRGSQFSLSVCFINKRNVYNKRHDGIIISYFMITIKAQKCANKNENITSEKYILFLSISLYISLLQWLGRCEILKKKSFGFFSRIHIARFWRKKNAGLWFNGCYNKNYRKNQRMAEAKSVIQNQPTGRCKY